MSDLFHGITPGYAYGKPGPLVAGGGEEPIFPESSETPIGLMSAMPAETLWDKTKRYAAIVWEAVKHPIKTLQRRA